MDACASAQSPAEEILAWLADRSLKTLATE
jgi:hypothetical protein